MLFSWGFVSIAWEVSKTTLRLNSFLEGLRKPSKAVVVMVMVYYRKRINILISNRKRLRRQDPGEVQVLVSHCPLPQSHVNGAYLSHQ